MNGHTPSRAAVEAKAITFSLGVMVLSFVILGSLVLFSNLRFSSTSAYGSTLASTLSAVIVMSFIVGYLWQKPKRDSRIELVKFFSNMTFLSISYGAVAFLLVIAISTVVANYTPVITGNSLFMAGMMTFILTVGAYVTYSHAAFMSASKLAGLFIIFISAGAIASMLTTQDATWLQHHFSALGAGNSMSSYAFNITMIIGGFLLVSLSDYIVRDLEQIKRNRPLNKAMRMNFLRIVFWIAGLCAIGIGLFPYDTFLLVHNIFANTMTIAFMALVLSIPWTLPMFTKPFIIQSYVIIAVALLVYSQFFIGDLNIFIIELIDAALLFMWMILFVRQIAALRDDQMVHGGA